MKKILFVFILAFLFIPNTVQGTTSPVVDITTLNIYELQEYVDEGYLTYEQITKIYLERIYEYDEMYNSVITINKDVLSQARALDEEYKESGRRSLLHGLPIMVKDNIDVVSMPTTNGASGLLNNYPIENAPIVQNLIDAGAIIIGKANMDEFAFNAGFSHSSFGYVHNAYNTSYSSYGSSGGSAVSVASNFAVAAIGSDTGSSIRLPSSANNLVGMRPTYEIIESDGIIKFEALRDVAGPMTKYVEDNAIILEIIDNVDTQYQPSLEEGSLEGIRIGVFTGVLNSSSSFIQAMVKEQIEVLESKGAEVVYLSTFYLSYEFDATTMAWDFNEYIKGTTGPITSFKDLIDSGEYTQYISSYEGVYSYKDYRETSPYKSYVSNRNSNISRANAQFENANIDAVIYPTLLTKQTLLSNVHSTKVQTYTSNYAPLVGFPSMNIPIGFSEGLSYGMEILSTSENEALIYNIGYNLQVENSYYKLPDIAPVLYEIDEDMETLLSYYEKEEQGKEYEAVSANVEEFILNYQYTEDKQSYIDFYIAEYEKALDPAIENEESDYHPILAFFIMIGASGLLVWDLRKKVFVKR